MNDDFHFRFPQMAEHDAVTLAAAQRMLAEDDLVEALLPATSAGGAGQAVASPGTDSLSPSRSNAAS